jgi:hypothetical protein
MIPEEPKEIEWDLEEIKKAYQEAAASDDFIFGDHDYSYIWMDNESNDVY